MDIYTFSPPDESYIVVADERRHPGSLRALSFPDKKPLASEWEPVSVEILWTRKHGPWTRRLKQADFPTPNFQSFVLGRKAIEAMGVYLSKYGELLKLSCDSEELWALNVTHVIDALDLERSEAVGAHYGNRDAPDIIRCAFRDEVVGSSDLFRVPQSNIHAIFFTKAFISEIERHGLTGFGWRRE